LASNLQTLLQTQFQPGIEQVAGDIRLFHELDEHFEKLDCGFLVTGDQIGELAPFVLQIV
jgi:hypothetical protein|tara:strand:+ start:1402 stop:1581 length:180 start_codon:yes stop_codon:yes gene_type:complete